MIGNWKEGTRIAECGISSELPTILNKSGSLRNPVTTVPGSDMDVPSVVAGKF